MQVMEVVVEALLEALEVLEAVLHLHPHRSQWNGAVIQVLARTRTEGSGRAGGLARQ